MVNFNGVVSGEGYVMELASNRGFRYGDGIFETLKVVSGQILFFEDHYFRLMSGMRILRMEIPMNFTMEYLTEQILMLVAQKGLQDAARVRLDVFRNAGGKYLPVTNDVSFLITAEPTGSRYSFGDTMYEVDLYKDFYVPAQLLSTIKSTNSVINVIASVFANENELDDCLLVNDHKNVISGLQGNLFMLSGNVLSTPPLSEGCIKGIMRTQVLKLAAKLEGIEVVEQIISPFDLQKADELFVTNVIRGIQPVTRYRKKEYTCKLSGELTNSINEMLVR
jgi:branched-chain amino acid aminotransferase